MAQEPRTCPRITRPLGILLLLTIAGFGLYANGLNVGRFGDDLGLVFENPSSRILSAFVRPPRSAGDSGPGLSRDARSGDLPPDPAAVQYRPIQTAVYALIQVLFGLNTVPIHTIHLVLHVLLSWLVYLALIRVGCSGVQAVLGSFFMLVSQVGSFPILASCTLEQIGAAVFGCLSLYLLHRYLRPTGEMGQPGAVHRRTSWAYVVSVISYGAALLSKEVGVSYFALLIVVIAAGGLAPRRRTAAIARGAVLLVPYVAVTILYLLARSQFGGLLPRFSGTTRYAFQVGPKILVHIGMSVAAAIQPVAGAKVFAALRSRDFLVLGLSGAGAIVTAGAVAWGLYRARCYRRTLCLAILTVGAMFPTVMLGHISELHVYNCLPFLSALVGIGLGAVFSSLNKAALKVAAAALICILAGHVVAIQQNTLMAKDNGRRTEALLSQVVSFVPQVPRDGTLLLVNPPPTGREYSRSVANGFDLLYSWNETRLVRRRSGRSDVKVKIVDWHKYATMPGSPDTLPLFTDGEKVSLRSLR